MGDLRKQFQNRRARETKIGIRCKGRGWLNKPKVRQVQVRRNFGRIVQAILQVRRHPISWRVGDLRTRDRDIDQEACQCSDSQDLETKSSLLIVL